MKPTDAQMHTLLSTLDSYTIDNMIQWVVPPNCFLSVVLKKKTYQISFYAQFFCTVGIAYET